MQRSHSFPNLMVHAFILLAIVLATGATAQEKRALTFQDMMKFRAIKSAVISDNGEWIAYDEVPDRGDGATKVRGINTGASYAIARGTKPAFASTSNWLVTKLLPRAVARAKAKKKNKLRPGLAVLNLATGETARYEKVDKYAFSPDGEWLAILHFKKKTNAAAKNKDEKKPETKRTVGRLLRLRHLADGNELQIPFAVNFAFDTTSTFLAYSLADTSGQKNGLYIKTLTATETADARAAGEVSGRYTSLRWNQAAGALAFLAAVEDSAGKTGPAELRLWDIRHKKTSVIAAAASVQSDWQIPAKNSLEWTRDGERLYFGLRPKKPESPEKDASAEPDSEKVLFDIPTILGKKEGDIWHWNDPYINSHQKKLWKRESVRTYAAVYDFRARKAVPLADLEMPDLVTNENRKVALGTSNVPYRKEITWAGRFIDAYLVNLKRGTRNKIAERLSGRSVYLSPGGGYIVYYADKNWFLYNTRTGRAKNLTAHLNVPFYNEDHDYPSRVPGYGIGGWVEKDKALFIYDKYDIWQFDTGTAVAMNLTAGVGRREQTVFRIAKLNKKQEAFPENAVLFLSAYNDREKYNAFYRAQAGTPGVSKLHEEKKRLRYLAKARNADVIMYTREDYDVFPDVWITGSDFKAPQKITDLNQQLAPFAWGTSELVEWRSLDGIPLQGVLIKPGNYVPGKKYPTLVYFYRFFSQRLHEFNPVVINHRPCFPLYASNGYAIFLPDIRFEIGRPGFAAVKCLVPGVQKLIEMGIADPEAVGLHGHSWSGYQTAFIVTQTDIFAAAVAGAPVSNMTSAYGGIRWGSGLSRQFQYERTQSRIGGSLWEYPERYIENSPLFFADRIHTPLLIEFGDDDGAVPWYQGIELYMAMRRLGKDCIFLQYRGEPHHLQKYPNKLDYAIKMKAYFDHYLKGTPAPDWIVKGELYQGK